jgi:Leucine-rich repeat (LRR) protein
MESGSAAKQQQNLDARSVALLNRLASRSSPSGLLTGLGKPGGLNASASTGMGVVGTPPNLVRGSGLLETMPIKHTTPQRPATASVTRPGTSPIGLQGRLLNLQQGSLGRLGEAPLPGARVSLGGGGNASNVNLNTVALSHGPLSAFHQDQLHVGAYGEQDRDRADVEASTGMRIAGSHMARGQQDSGNSTSLVISRSNEEKLANPDRLVLDRRKLTVCPVLEGEERLRLLNYQNNFISKLENLHNLPNLIFLDLYNNQIKTMENLDQVKV